MPTSRPRTNSRYRRAFRRQVLARDKHRCTVPGCRATANVDCHHIVPRADGGSNKPENLTTLCSAHHLLLHGGKLTMTGLAPDAIRFGWSRPPPDPTGTTLVEADARRALVTMGFKPA